MTAVKREIQYASNFSMTSDNVRIITGEEEGFYGWATANYLEDIFSKVIPFKFPFSLRHKGIEEKSLQI